jgi:citrate synthase
VSAGRAALVMLADHEMAASTLAARIAASARADVHGVVAAGMGTLNGGDSARCRRVLQLVQDRPVDNVIDRALERDGHLPGLGQGLYPKEDLRASEPLTLLHEVGPHPALDQADRFIEATLVVGQRRLADAGRVETTLRPQRHVDERHERWDFD